MASQKPVIIVVPGAYHRPIHYRKLIDPLRVEGYEVISIDLVVCGEEVDPGMSFFDDGAAVRKVLIPFLDEGRKAVVVSHSYGSLPTSVIVEGLTLAERAEKGLQGGIVGVVNLAGFVFPVPGKNIMGKEDEIPNPPYQVVKVRKKRGRSLLRVKDSKNYQLLTCIGWRCPSPRKCKATFLLRTRSRGGRC